MGHPARGGRGQTNLKTAQSVPTNGHPQEREMKSYKWNYSYGKGVQHHLGSVQATGGGNQKKMLTVLSPVHWREHYWEGRQEQSRWVYHHQPGPHPYHHHPEWEEGHTHTREKIVGYYQKSYDRHMMVLCTKPLIKVTPPPSLIPSPASSHVQNCKPDFESLLFYPIVFCGTTYYTPCLVSANWCLCKTLSEWKTSAQTYSPQYKTKR